MQTHKTTKWRKLDKGDGKMTISKKRMAEIEFDANVDTILQGSGINSNDAGVQLMYKGIQLFKIKEEEYDFEEFIFYVENHNPMFEIKNIKNEIKQLVKGLNDDLKGRVNMDLLNLRDIFTEKVLDYEVETKNDYILLLARYCLIHYLLINSGIVDEV